jgi:hypothetical protein
MTRRVTYDLTPPPGAPAPTQPGVQGSTGAPGSDTAAKPGATTAPGASYRQLNYLRDLVSQRDLNDEAKRALEARIAVQQELNDKHGDCAPPLAAAGLTKRKASEFIERLNGLPKRAPKRPADAPRDIMSDIARDAGHGVPSPDDLPAGYYAIKNADGELRFYHVHRRRDNPKFVRLYVQHGQDDSEIPWGREMRAILTAIVEAEPFQCAMRYGQHIGECSECHTRLTNRISRLLGIGPICGGHHCDPAVWRDMKRRAREALLAAGLDPDADVNDTDDLAAVRAAAGLAL